VLAVFPISKVGKIAGCRVVDGELRRNGKIRLLRGNDIVFEGEVSSLKHEKEDVREVRNGLECGLGLKNFHDILVGDILECYLLEKNG
jgi:translation initiation factor IF-2